MICTRGQTRAGYFLGRKGALHLVIEHRAAAAPKPLKVRLAEEPRHLEICGTDAVPLAEAVRAELRRAAAPLPRAALRRTLRVNNAASA